MVVQGRPSSQFSGHLSGQARGARHRPVDRASRVRHGPRHYHGWTGGEARDGLVPMSVPNVSEGLGARLGDPLQGPCTATAFVDGRGRISLWSMEAEALLGYSANEVCGTLAADLLTAPRAGKRRWPRVSGIQMGRAGTAWWP